MIKLKVEKDMALFKALFKALLKTKTKNQQKFLGYGLIVIVAILAFFVLFLPNPIQARTFNPNNIITDQELLNKDSLSKTAIQTFLAKENSVLARFSQIVDGSTLKASEMIGEIGQKHGINPKFLLATLEKEQGLIHKSQATEKALDWATGYGCYQGNCKEKYRGFYNQVEATAETQQIYWEKVDQLAFRAGETTTTFDGYLVTPENKATANLYIYTPYVGYAPDLGITSLYGGNKLFWRIWQRYFTNQKFLDGQVIKNGDNLWLIQNNTKRKFASQEIFLKDYKLSDAIVVTQKDKAAYPDGPPINFANNTLVKSASSGQIFLLADHQKRPIINVEALTLLSDFQTAVTENEISAVTEDQLTGYQLGTLISSNSIYPQGKLFKDETGKIWQVKDNLKHEVDPVVWQNRFNSQNLEATTSVELEKYPTGSPVKLEDGTFVKIDEKYYLISSGERMKIENLQLFDQVFGLDKKNGAVSVSTALLEVHEAGETIDYIDDTITDSTSSTPSSTSSGSYSASFNSMEPDGLIMITGEMRSVTFKFKNAGSANWQAGEVYLAVTDKGKDTSSFGTAKKTNFSESSVSNSQIATFTFDLTAPTQQSGVLTQEFNLYYSKNGTPTKITSIGKFIIVKPGVAAQILEHNIPVAVRNKWKPVVIRMKIKNISPDTIWLAKKTALEIYDAAGKTSPFYDPNDWVRKEVAAVPLNKSTIKPGEVGEFKFTLDPRGIKPGTYILNFQLKLLDKNKDVYLDGRLEWRREIRVD